MQKHRIHGDVASRKISDELWTALESLIPAFSPDSEVIICTDPITVRSQTASGMPRTHVFFEKDLLQGFPIGSNMPCRRSLGEDRALTYGAYPIWLSRRLREYDQIEPESINVDVAGAPQPPEARKPVSNPADRGKHGRK